MNRKNQGSEKARVKYFLIASKSIINRSERLKVYEIVSPSLSNCGFRQLEDETAEQHCLRYLLELQYPKSTKKKKTIKVISACTKKVVQVTKPNKVLTKDRVDVTSDEFLSTFEWKQLRMLAFKTHGNTCQCCGASPSTGAVLNVDHIKPRKLHPELALDIKNLQILCSDCNHGKGNWDQTDWRSQAS